MTGASFLNSTVWKATRVVEETVTTTPLRRAFPAAKARANKRKIHATRESAKCDLFNHIEMFYKTKLQHGSNDGLSPVEYERQYFRKAEKHLVNKWRFRITSAFDAT